MSGPGSLQGSACPDRWVLRMQSAAWEFNECDLQTQEIAHTGSATGCEDTSSSSSVSPPGLRTPVSACAPM